MRTLEERYERLVEEVGELRKQIKKYAVRIDLAQAWLAFLHRAYDALLSYRVNYRDLPEYRETEVLDEAARRGTEEGQRLVHRYLNRLSSAIEAAIRRRELKLVVDNKELPKPEDQV